MPLNDFRSVHMPYALQLQDDGSYVIVNREYKPIGFRTSDYINYEKYPIAVRFKNLTKPKAAKLSCRPLTRFPDSFALYDDGSIPTRSPKNMKKYLEKLAILANLKIVAEPKKQILAISKK